MKGMSESVSSTFSHFDFPRVIIQAMGIPAIISMNETRKATAKDAAIAFEAAEMSSGWFNTSCIEPHFITMPKIGGSRINAKNTIIESM